MKRIVLTTILLVLMLSLALSSSPVMAAGSLTVTPSSASLTIPDDRWNGDYVQVVLKNNGDARVSNLRYAKSGQIASWITFHWDSYMSFLNPGGSFSFPVRIDPPGGQAPGTYRGRVTFYGKDTKSGNTVSAFVDFTITVPRRPLWYVVSGPMINGQPSICTVNVNQKFEVSIEVINGGNVPVTTINGVLSLPSGFVLSQNPVSVGNLNSYGQRVKIKWYATATRPTATYLKYTVTLSSNIGTLTRTRSIRAV